MEVKMTNIGIIKHGRVNLDDITIIAGENDTGKSTISKLIYSIIKSNLNYEEDYNDFIVRKLAMIVKRLYRQLRKIVKLELNSYLKENLSPIIFERRLKSSMHSIEDISRITYDYIQLCKELLFTKNSKDINSIHKTLEEIKDMLHSIQYRLSREELMKASLMKTLKTEFKENITKRPSRGQSKVQVLEGNNVMLGLKMTDNMIEDILFNDELIYPDVTYIESPLILNASIRNNLRTNDRNMDLVNKLSDTSLKYDGWYDDSIQYIMNSYTYKDQLLNTEGLNTEGLNTEGLNIHSIINGTMEYNIDDNEFYFRKNKKNKYNIENVASGVKAFGMLDILIKNNSLEPDSLLIVDEPEIHLHPKWQIEYGRIVCELAKSGIKILLSTHSPYIIEAINHYSQKYEISNRVNYYVTEKINSESTNIVNCNDDLNRIFQMLSEPIEKLVWGSFDA